MVRGLLVETSVLEMVAMLGGPSLLAQSMGYAEA